LKNKIIDSAYSEEYLWFFFRRKNEQSNF